ncbi:uncharacterized protein DUF2292 [Hydrogenispora ethanolica]|jgi:hypothetical protein|uniref:Uncharacterized protein DUF2292 n=1 Tax=Hydrogenispora ethanolica TaxID=1082276 RepID=A0A4R1R913_HYDET|nr:DUF2292 domain-containing protein [Hydrogenispora ethanolica]TCL62173.1 uncharacterized protein DUF2292 [Hydrogenispora ethanolica]
MMAIGRTFPSLGGRREPAQVIWAALRGLKNGSVTIVKQDNQIIQVNIYEVIPSEARCTPFSIG